MITILGDTADELAILQDVIETGVLNGNKKARLDVTIFSGEKAPGFNRGMKDAIL